MVSVCRELGVALVPQGGNTGLVGGGVPLHGEVVLSLRRLTALEPVDTLSGQVTAGAGVALADLQRRRRSAGGHYGVDLASRDSATVGGTVATNAGGLHVLRYGDTRAQVVGSGGGARDRRRALPSRRAGEGQHRLPPGRAGVRQRGDPGRRHRGPPAPRARRCPSGPSPCWPSPPSPTRSTPPVALRRALPSLEACELFFSSGLELVRSVDRDYRRPSPVAAPGLSARRGGRPRPIPRRRWPKPCDATDHVADVAVATESGPAGRTLALPRGPHRGHQHPGPAAQARRGPAAARFWPGSSTRCPES